MALFDGGFGGDGDWFQKLLNPGAPTTIMPPDPAPAAPPANGPNVSDLSFGDQLRYNLTGDTAKNADLGKGISQAAKAFQPQPPPSPKQQAGAVTPAQQHQMAGIDPSIFSKVTNGKQSPFGPADPNAPVDPMHRKIYQV